MEDVRQEIDNVLNQQKEKGLKRWEIALSLFAKGFSEKQVGIIMDFDHRTAHAMKVDIAHGKAKREIRNYLKLDVIKMQSFMKNCKMLAGEPAHREEKKT